MLVTLQSQIGKWQRNQTDFALNRCVQLVLGRKIKNSLLSITLQLQTEATFIKTLGCSTAAVAWPGVLYGPRCNPRPRVFTLLRIWVCKITRPHTSLNQTRGQSKLRDWMAVRRADVVSAVNSRRLWSCVKAMCAGQYELRNRICRVPLYSAFTCAESQ